MTELNLPWRLMGGKEKKGEVGENEDGKGKNCAYRGFGGSREQSSKFKIIGRIKNKCVVFIGPFNQYKQHKLIKTISYRGI